MDVVGYEGRYLIGDKGTIKSWLSREGKRFIPKELKRQKVGSGYGYINLIDGSGKTSRKLIHRLVAECFVPGRTDQKNEVNHLDLDKGNNRADNLEWCSRQGNMRHASLSGSFDEIKDKLSKVYDLRHPSGFVIRIKNLSEFCRLNGLNAGNLRSRKKGNDVQCKGWEIV